MYLIGDNSDLQLEVDSLRTALTASRDHVRLLTINLDEAKGDAVSLPEKCTTDTNHTALPNLLKRELDATKAKHDSAVQQAHGRNSYILERT